MEPMVSPIRPSLINWSPVSGLMLNVSRMRTFSPLVTFYHLYGATVPEMLSYTHDANGLFLGLYSPSCLEGWVSRKVRLSTRANVCLILRGRVKHEYALPYTSASSTSEASSLLSRA